MTTFTRPHDAGHGATAPRENPVRRAVLLINLGTPDRPDAAAVRRYLREFLSDPAVIRLPRGFGWCNPILGRLIARFRAQSSASLYARIWSERGSPLRSITEDQVTALAAAMPKGWRVYFAMRYGSPSIARTLTEIAADGTDELVIVPMYPQFSEPTTGTALSVVYDQLKRRSLPFNVTTRTTWYDDHGYIAAQADLIAEYARAHGLGPDNCYLLFSTHGLPTAYVRRGDPYPTHVARTVSLVTARLGWPQARTSLAYQSRFGPVEWLKPYTDERLAALGAAGEKRVLICPISFTADCLETLEELDIRYREVAEETGTDLYLCPALNSYAPFIKALKGIALNGPRPIRESDPSVGSLETGKGPASSVDCAADGLMMIGASLAPRLETDRGPSIQACGAAALQRVKRSQTEVPALLRRICEEPGVREALLLNTCQRFELYVSRDTAVCPEAEELAKRLRSLLLGDRRSLEGPGGPFGDLPLNVVHDDIAWHHLVRTVAGLSSNLPGERDVLDQLLAAHRLASCAQAAGPRMDELVRGVEARVQRLREETPWGRFTADYALAAMSGIVTGSDLNLTLRRIVVIGGSTTSAGVLHTLREHFDVPDRQLTLFYRGHKRGHLKDLRRAIGGGRRVRVQSYDQRCVVEAIREADVVVLGLDRTEPVVTSEALRGLRDFSARPLTVFDFNLFGSTRGLRSLPGAELYDAGRLDAEVARFAEARRHAESFRRAVDEAEAWIQHEVRALRPGSDAESPLGTAGAEGDAGRRHVGHATPVAALVCERMVS